MSWQRIDENTYIDDTLVTCAEYQLFIDEMREQGKYFQPDNWTSYQFPTGQAREPILGGRQSDARSFCSWLTRREDGKWMYRLLTHKEANIFPKKNLPQSPLGYWLDEDFQFSWVGDISVGTQALTRNRVIDLNPTVDFNHDHILDRGLELYHAVDRSRAHALDIDRYINTSLDRIIDLSLDLARDRTLFFVCDRIRDITINHADILHLAVNHASDRDRAFNFTPVHDVALAFVIYRCLRFSVRFPERGALALDIFIDALTLQERIAGRSPAFEGIRLVKERIK